MASKPRRQGTALSTLHGSLPACVKSDGGGGGRTSALKDGHKPDALRGAGLKGDVRTSVREWLRGTSRVR